jgi:hypothetical protein
MPVLNIEPDPREARLPAWARGLIDGLRAHAEAVRRAHARADEEARQARLDTGPDGSTAVLYPYSDRGPVGLGPEAQVRFLLGRGRWVDVRVNPRTGEIELNGDCRLIFTAYSSNVVMIKTEGR